MLRQSVIVHRSLAGPIYDWNENFNLNFQPDKVRLRYYKYITAGATNVAHGISCNFVDSRNQVLFSFLDVTNDGSFVDSFHNVIAPVQHGQVNFRINGLTDTLIATTAVGVLTFCLEFTKDKPKPEPVFQYQQPHFVRSSFDNQRDVNLRDQKLQVDGMPRQRGGQAIDLCDAQQNDNQRSVNLRYVNLEDIYEPRPSPEEAPVELGPQGPQPVSSSNVPQQAGTGPSIDLKDIKLEEKKRQTMELPEMPEEKVSEEEKKRRKEEGKELEKRMRKERLEERESYP